MSNSLLNKIVIGLIILVSIVYGLCSVLYPIKYSNYIVHYSRCFDIDSSIVASVINCHRSRRYGVSKYTNFHRALVGVRDLLGVLWLRKRTRYPRSVREC